MRSGIARVFLPFVIASLLLFGFVLAPGISSMESPRGGESHLGVDLSSTMTIFANCTTRNNTQFSVGGTTFTLNASYTGSVLDECNGSTLMGGGNTLVVSGGGAGVQVLADNVTITGFDFAASGSQDGVEVTASTNVSVVANNFTTSYMAIVVSNSVSVTITGNIGPSTEGLQIEDSSSIFVLNNNFSGSIMDGFQGGNLTHLDLVGNNFSFATHIGLDLNEVTSLTVRDNQIASAGSGTGEFLTDVAEGNFSSNNDSGNLYAIATYVCAGLTFWNNTVSIGTPFPYEIGASSQISIIDSVGLGATIGADLYGDNGVTLDEVNFADSGEGVRDNGSVGVTIENSLLDSGGVGVLAIDAVGLSIIASNLTHGNDGLEAQETSNILVKDSNLSRANYPLYLTKGTTGVTVEHSQLDDAQESGVSLNGDSNISIDQSSIRFAVVAAVVANFTPELTISSTNMSDSATDPGLAGFASELSNSTSLLDDSFDWLQSPVYDVGSTGITIVGSDFSNTTGTYALDLVSDVQVLVTGSDFFDESGNGIGLDLVTHLTVSDSDLAGIVGDGFLATNSEDLSVTGSDFVNDGGSAIFLASVQGFVASDNHLDNDSYAFFLNSEIEGVIANNTALADRDGGLIASSSSGLVLIGNNISEEPDNVVVDLMACPNFELTDNAFFEDYRAVAVSGASTGTLVGNAFTDDRNSFDFESAVEVQSYHNDFDRVLGWIIAPGATLAWDDGYPVGGNFWSNYTGADHLSGPGQNIPGADGIGDAPFVLDPVDIDHYPLMTSWIDHAAVFISTGLPLGTPWSVIFNGTRFSATTNQITVMATVGVETPYTYSIPTVQSYVPSHPHGSGLLGDGLVVVDVTWAVPTYSVTFGEAGLPTGAIWGVTINGTQYSGPEENFSLELPNGTYGYSVDSVPGYTLSPTSGVITVAGLPQTLNLTFVPFTYSVTVTESGLASGTGWGILISEVHTTSTMATITVFLANGSYGFAVDAVTGYTSAPAGGSWSISGGPLSVNVQFTSNSQVITPPVGTIIPTNPNLLPYYGIIIALGAAAAVGWILAGYGRRDRSPPRPSSPSTSSSTPPGKL